MVLCCTLEQAVPRCLHNSGAWTAEPSITTNTSRDTRRYRPGQTGRGLHP